MPSSFFSLTQALLMLASLVGWALVVAGAVILRARLGTPGSRWLLRSAVALTAWQVVNDLLLLLGGLMGGFGGVRELMLGSGAVHAALWLAVSGSFFVAMRELSRAWRAGAFAGAAGSPPGAA